MLFDGSSVIQTSLFVNDYCLICCTTIRTLESKVQSVLLVKGFK
jgi:hypothetical protein